MSSLSLSRIPRPYQFALLAVLIVAVLWFAVLHKMVSSSSSESTSSSAPPPTSVHSPHRAIAPPLTHHPGVTVKAGAHGVVGASPAHRAAATTHHAASATTKPQTATHAAAAAGTASKAATPAPGASTKPTVVKEIESELKENKIVLALFWNPKASLDQFVQRQLKVVAQVSSGVVATHYAQASQVAEFGVYTQKVLINETPTILMIQPGGHTSTLVGYNDVKSITQAIAEAGNPFAAVSENALVQYRQSVAKACAPVEAKVRKELPTAFSPNASPQQVQQSLHSLLAEEAALIATLRKLPTPAGTDGALLQKDIKAAEHLFAQLRGILTRMVADARSRNTAALVGDIKQLSSVSGGGFEVVADVCPNV